MSDQIQKILNVVVTEGNNGLATAGQTEEQVADKTLAFIDLDTGKTVGTFDKKGYFIFKHGSDVVRTDFIDPSKITNKYKATPVNPASKEVLIRGFENVKCCEEVVLRFRLRNQLILRALGRPHTFWSAYSASCQECVDPNQVVGDLMKEINEDKNNFLTAIPVEITPDGQGGETITEITDWEAFYNANHAANTDADPANDVVAALKIVADPLELKRFCDVHNIYYNPSVGDFDVLSDKCSCEGSKGLDIQVTQEVIIGEGLGENILFLEGFANGWQGRRPVVPFSNYAQGMVDAKPTYADPSLKYVQYVVEFVEFQPVNQGYYNNHHKTLIIAVPESDTATASALDSFLGVV